MNDKRKKYGAVVSASHELLDRYPAHTPRIEEELVHKLADPIIKEAIKGECIVRFTETRQREDFTTDLIAFYKSVCVEKIVRCKDCRYYDYPFPDPKESADAYPERWCCLLGMGGAFGKDDYCSHGERRNENV